MHKTFEEVKQISGHLNSVYSVKFSPDDTKLISCSRDTTIRIWDFNSGKELGVIKTEGRGLADIDISPDGKKLATGSYAQTAKIWELAPDGWILGARKSRQLAGLNFQQLDVYTKPNSKNHKGNCLL